MRSITGPIDIQKKKMDNNQESPVAEQPPTTEAKWIPVEDLAEYYANHKSIGRKHPAQPQLDFDNLYIDNSRHEIQDSESEADENKEATKLAKKPSLKLMRTPRVKVEAKAEPIAQPVTSKSTKEKGKSKLKEGSSEDEEESSEEDKKEEPMAKNCDEEKYKSCNTCTWARVKCVAGKKLNKDGGRICLQCEKHGRQCHFSIKGQRPGKP
ncbi:hypothetical protein QM012_001170 [Aureobasidium pullulans]|uniref:Zn(2)-C6 fungal-type domain-containing protein n=1 Tax=Aureobasidium pullulans TaxID=5580 RepID=A0ABR0TH85_AURPU